MLIQRVVTALVLLPLLLGLVWFAPTPVVYGAFALAGAMIAWEWSGLMSGLSANARLVYAATVAAILAGAWWTPLRDAWLPVLLGAACAWWLFAPVLFRGFPDNLRRRPLGNRITGPLGVLMIGAAANRKSARAEFELGQAALQQLGGDRRATRH